MTVFRIIETLLEAEDADRRNRETSPAMGAFKTLFWFAAAILLSLAIGQLH
ncbi:hypothetical protein [Salidesulfovibrio onnuriiensis]|uniref:hypothetical protein n=1 Tax=Salidesulfovibrio onnuriiensis TaxID=2583823 RepID=UPI00164F6237|nr:hypothetical protein [Salidesulfovibrio onnuriiensis]